MANKQNIAKIFLKLDNEEYQKQNQLSNEEIKEIKQDRTIYLKKLIQTQSTIFPNELVDFDQIIFKNKTKTYGNKSEHLEKTNLGKELGIEDIDSAGKRDESNEIWNSDYGDMNDHFEESHDEQSYEGDDGKDAYD